MTIGTVNLGLCVFLFVLWLCKLLFVLYISVLNQSNDLPFFKCTLSRVKYGKQFPIREYLYLYCDEQCFGILIDSFCT